MYYTMSNGANNLGKLLTLQTLKPMQYNEIGQCILQSQGCSNLWVLT